MHPCPSPLLTEAKGPLGGGGGLGTPILQWSMAFVGSLATRSFGRLYCHPVYATKMPLTKTRGLPGGGGAQPKLCYCLQRNVACPLRIPDVVTPPPLYKLRQSRKLLRSLRLLQLGHGRGLRATHTTTNTGHPDSKREDCMVSQCKKGAYNAQTSQKSELSGFKWQTLTTNVSMTLCDSQIRHQTHALCSCTTFGTELKLGPKLILSLRLL